MKLKVITSCIGTPFTSVYLIHDEDEIHLVTYRRDNCKKDGVAFAQGVKWAIENYDGSQRGRVEMVVDDTLT